METLSLNNEKNFTNLRKRLITSFMDLLILSRLREKAMSGYDIISLFKKEFHTLLSSGSVYNLLKRLERRGLIEGTWEGRRRIYKITKKGKATVEATPNFYQKIEDFILMRL